MHGVADATMLHGEAWEFFRLGRCLERACQTARILDVKYHMLLPTVEDVGSAVDNAHWVAILMSCSGYEPFHKTARAGALDTGLAVVEFLVFDPLFPRSVAFCLKECQWATGGIAGPGPRSAAQARLADLAGWLAGHDVHTLVAGGLHESLTAIVDRVHDVGGAIHASYFGAAPVLPAHSQSQRQ